MARKQQLDLCLPKIKDFFDKSLVRSFTEQKFKRIFSHYRNDWDIPLNKHGKQVLNYLVKKDFFIPHVYIDSNGKNKLLYSLKDQDEFTILTGLKSNSYYAFYSALFLHQLTLQIPKKLYLNFEHSSAMNNAEAKNELTQAGIDEALHKEQRKSLKNYTYTDKKIILTNGKYTNKLGIERQQSINQCFEYTNLERTMIDISVRPVYAGGIFEVFEAFKQAKSKVDVKKMAGYLEKLDYIYPYHQIIGFYLEKAGYNKKEVDYFSKEMKFDFYLTYNIRIKEYSKKWQLYYPKGF